MEIAQKLDIGKGNEKLFNQCRIYLRCTHLSEITDGMGLFLTDSFLQPDKSSKIATDDDGWARQGLPRENAWQIWDSVLRSLVYGGTSRLRQPLGRWEATLAPTSLLCPETNRIFVRSDQGYLEFAPNQSKYRRMTFGIQMIGESSLALPRGLPCIIEEYGGRTTCNGWREVQTNKPPASWMDMALLRDTSWATQLSTESNISGVQNLIVSGKAYAVCDGSFKDRIATSAFIVTSLEDYDTHVTGVNRAPGPKDLQDAYRADLCGMIGVVALTNAICDFYHISQGSVTCACDNLEAVRQAAAKVDDHRPLNHADLIVVLRAEVAKSSIQWHFHHVKGHQDDERTFDDLDPISKLNCLMDTEAKRFRSFQASGHHHRNHVESPAWTISIAGFHICKDIKNELYFHIVDGTAKKYWTNKLQLDAESADNIAWPELGKALRGLSCFKRNWLAKLGTNFLPTADRLQIFENDRSPLCPRCGRDESNQHLLCCRSERALQTLDGALLNLGRKLSVDTPFEISRAIITCISTYCKTGRTIPYTSTYFSLQRAIKHQNNIGWNRFLHGFLSHTWTDLMNKYYIFTGSRRTGNRWTTKTIRRVWEIPWAIWLDRNSALHDDNKNKNTLSTLKLRRATLASLYSDLPPRQRREDRELFSSPLTALLAMNLSNTKYWIASAVSLKSYLDQHHA